MLRGNPEILKVCLDVVRTAYFRPTADAAGGVGAPVFAHEFQPHKPRPGQGQHSVGSSKGSNNSVVPGAVGQKQLQKNFLKAGAGRTAAAPPKHSEPAEQRHALALGSKSTDGGSTRGQMTDSRPDLLNPGGSVGSTTHGGRHASAVGGAHLAPNSLTTRSSSQKLPAEEQGENADPVFYVVCLLKHVVQQCGNAELVVGERVSVSGEGRGQLCHSELGCCHSELGCCPSESRRCRELRVVRPLQTSVTARI